MSSSSLDVSGVCRKCSHNFLPSDIHGLKTAALETASLNYFVLFVLSKDSDVCLTPSCDAFNKIFECFHFLYLNESDAFPFS